MSNNKVFGINGPVVTVADTKDFSMQETVFVGKSRLVGEVISIEENLTTIQVYEETTGLTPGEPVEGTGSAMSVTLGPGIIKNIYDGIQRPLREIERSSGPFIARGCTAAGIDENVLWDVTVTAKVGDVLCGGDTYATC
ncbi:MAG: V-type ATP synthase subunit A, partial [Clostridia bacterium]|nr:V-type ATP synthase subunit A [Clostridia bacterium]